MSEKVTMFGDVRNMPYIKVKCRDCKNVMHLYFAKIEDMPKAQKGEYIEYFCDICEAKRLFEVLE